MGSLATQVVPDLLVLLRRIVNRQRPRVAGAVCGGPLSPATLVCQDMDRPSLTLQQLGPASIGRGLTKSFEAVTWW